MRSLRDAITISPTLTALPSQFAATCRGKQQGSRVQILKAWSDASLMAATFTGAYFGLSLSINMQNIATGKSQYTALANKFSLLEHFNGSTFNVVSADMATNAETWRIAA